MVIREGCGVVRHCAWWCGGGRGHFDTGVEGGGMPGLGLGFRVFVFRGEE